MTTIVQSSPLSVLKSAENTPTNLNAVEIERSICDIFAGLDDIYANLKKQTSIMDNCIPTQAKKEQKK